MLLFFIGLLGGLAAFYITGHLILHERDPYRRVALYLTILVVDVTTVTLAYFLLTEFIQHIFFTFAFTKCFVWVIMDKSAMVFADNNPEE